MARYEHGGLKPFLLYYNDKDTKCNVQYKKLKPSPLLDKKIDKMSRKEKTGEGDAESER